MTTCYFGLAHHADSNCRCGVNGTIGIPKPRPHALVKADRKAKLKAKDEAENRKAIRRANGQCEVEVLQRHRIPGVAETLGMYRRCWRPPEPKSHHLIGGNGRRNRGRSILAECRIAACKFCHREITDHILVPVPGCDREKASEVRYERRT